MTVTSSSTHHQAAALYLFLITVAGARRNLVQVGLIAYQKPIYQVLALDGNLAPVTKTVTGKPSCRRPQSLKQILKQIMEDTP